MGIAHGGSSQIASRARSFGVLATTRSRCRFGPRAIDCATSSKRSRKSRGRSAAPACTLHRYVAAGGCWAVTLADGQTHYLCCESRADAVAWVRALRAASPPDSAAETLAYAWADDAEGGELTAYAAARASTRRATPPRRTSPSCGPLGAPP